MIETISNAKMNYYIFRHGETHTTKTGEEYGATIVTAEILPEGIPVIKRLANYLKDIPTDFNVRSEFARVKQTAEIISEITGKKFQKDKRLNDVMLPPDSVNPKDYPFIETYNDITKRVNGFLQDLDKKGYKNVLIGTHGGIIAAIKHLLIENKFEGDDLYDFPRPGVLTIIREGKIQEIDFN